MNDVGANRGDGRSVNGGGEVPGRDRTEQPSGSAGASLGVVGGKVPHRISTPTGGPFRFAGFSFDPRSGQLSGSDRQTELRNQTAKALELLLLRAGTIVTRDELRQRLWGDEVHVDFDQGINTCIREIRAALGDSPDELRFVETLPGRGYRFLVPVEAALGQAESTPRGTGRADHDRQQRRRRFLATVCVVCGVLVALVALAFMNGRRPGALNVRVATAPVRVVVGAFENRTGESLLDDSLETAFLIGLKRHRGLAFVPSDQLDLALARMHRSRAERLDRSLSLEVAQRLNADVVILGQTFRVGPEYLVTVEALGPADGGTIYALTEKARQQGDLLGILDRLADGLADRLVGGEALASTTRRRPSLSQVTTENLEALKAYSLGERAIEDGRMTDASSNLKRAIELDPEFAMAHARLAVVYRNVGEPAEAIRHFTLAKSLAERLTEFEALYVDAWLASIEPDPDRAVALWTVMADRFPEHPSGSYNEAVARFTLLGDSKGCVEGLSRVIEVTGPGFYPLTVQGARAQCLAALGEEELALADLREVLATDVPSAPLVASAVELLAALGLEDEAERRLEAFEMNDRSRQAPLLAQTMHARLALGRGREEAAFADLERAAELAHDEGKSVAELGRWINALSLVELGRWTNEDRSALEQRVLGRVEELLANPEVRALALVIRADALAGAYLARAGSVEEARSIRGRIDALRRARGLGPLWQGYVDLLDSELALRDGRPDEAVMILEQSMSEAPGPPFHARETLVRAYRALGDEPSAERVERWIADHRGRAFVEILGSEIDLDWVRNVLCFQRAEAALGGKPGETVEDIPRLPDGGGPRGGSAAADSVARF